MNFSATVVTRFVKVISGIYRRKPITLKCHVLYRLFKVSDSVVLVNLPHTLANGVFQFVYSMNTMNYWRVHLTLSHFKCMDDCGLRQMKKEVVRLCIFCTAGYFRKTRLFKGNYLNVPLPFLQMISQVNVVKLCKLTMKNIFLDSSIYLLSVILMLFLLFCVWCAGFSVTVNPTVKHGH